MTRSDYRRAHLARDLDGRVGGLDRYIVTISATEIHGARPLTGYAYFEYVAAWNGEPLTTACRKTACITGAIEAVAHLDDLIAQTQQAP